MQTDHLQRNQRTRDGDPRMLPWPLDAEADVVAVDTTWGELQPMQAAPGIRTVGEVELMELVKQGATVIDARSPGTTGDRTIPGSRRIPHDQVTEQHDDLDPERISILFCNGPQCPQSPGAIRELVEHGHPTGSLAYYRGGMHDWVTLSMPTETTGD